MCKVKRRTFLMAGCVLLSVFMLSACSGFHQLDQPYSYTDRPAFYTAKVMEGKAVPFASNLCVVTDELQNQDASVTAEAAAVFDVNSRLVVYSKNAFERLYPASVTKVMTALIAVKYGNMTDMVTVTRDAVITEAGATLCRIKPGDRLTMEQLMYGLMLPSGNDAGAAIAVHMSDSIEAFAKLMNAEAKKLGATGTHFVNPHGLNDDNHYTTAYDLYLIFNEALKYPEFRQIISTPAYKAQYVDKEGAAVTQEWKFTNWYMTGERSLPDGLAVLGGKTGTTQAAGNCLIMGTEGKDNKEYISVVLKAQSRLDLYDNMSNILNKIAD